MKKPWHWHRLTRLPFLSEGDTGWRAGQACETARTGVWVWVWEPRAGVWSEKGPKPEPLETATLKRREEEPERTICQEEREPGPGGAGGLGGCGQPGGIRWPGEAAEVRPHWVQGS